MQLPAIETQPGLNQGHLWTEMQENIAWRMFVTIPQNQGKWGMMSAELDKSVKACRRKVEKIYKNEGKKEVWQLHKHVKLGMERDHLPWSAEEIDILQSTAVDFVRLGELLGRDPEKIKAFDHKLKHAGAMGFIPE